MLTPQQQQIEDRVTALEKGQREILDLLKPIAETYSTVTRLGKWLMAAAVFISICIGILLSLKSFFKKP